jgi:hypothetical protein
LNLQFIAAANLNSLFASLPSTEVFVPRVAERRPVWESAPAAPRPGATGWQRLSPDRPYQTTAIRVDHPVKGFFLPAQEGVGAYPAAKPLEPRSPRRVIVGAKACDLAALKTYDAVFTAEPVKDDFFAARRKNTLIVAADCPEPAPTCWCTVLGGKPWPT